MVDHSTNASPRPQSNSNADESQKKDFRNKIMNETEQRLSDHAKSLKIPSLMSTKHNYNKDTLDDIIGRVVTAANQQEASTKEELSKSYEFIFAEIKNKRALQKMSSSPIFKYYGKRVLATNLLLISIIPIIFTFFPFLKMGVNESTKLVVCQNSMLLIAGMCICFYVLNEYHQVLGDHNYDTRTCFDLIHELRGRLLSFVCLFGDEIGYKYTYMIDEIFVVADCNGIGPTYISLYINLIKSKIADGSWEWSTCLNVIRLTMEYKIRYDTEFQNKFPEKMSKNKLESEIDFFGSIKQMIEKIPFIKDDKSGKYIFSITSKELDEMEETKKLDKCTILWYKYLNQSYRKAVTNNIDITQWNSDGMKKILDGPYNLDAIDVELTDYDYEFRFDIFSLLNMKDCQIITKDEKGE